MSGIMSLRYFKPVYSYPPTDESLVMTSEKRTAQRDLMLALIVEMTVCAASPIEIAQAIKHSMVILDAEKQNLNYVQSALDNDIVGLVQKYVNTTQEVIDSITN